MVLQIPDVLTAEQVAEARRLLQSAHWADGRVTALGERYPSDVSAEGSTSECYFTYAFYVYIIGLGSVDGVVTTLGGLRPVS